MKASERYKICKSCPEFSNNKLGGNCKICGCFLKVKTKIKSSHCPIKKW